MPRPLTKVRIGYGLGVRTSLNGDGFGELVDELERMRFDSLWLSERIGGEAPDPVSAIAYGAGRTSHLKFGMSVLVLPGRNPIVLAKNWRPSIVCPAAGCCSRSGSVSPIHKSTIGPSTPGTSAR